MPKRSSDLEYYLAKMRKLERRIKRHHKRRRYESSEEKDTVVSCSQDSDKSDFDDPTEGGTETSLPSHKDSPMIFSSGDPVVNETGEPSIPVVQTVDNTELVQMTDPEVLLALGDLLPDKPKCGPAINSDVARIWSTILKDGLQKESKQKLLEFPIPENCLLLKAPQLNQELSSSVTPNIVNRDKKIEMEQNHLGVGLAIIGSALSTLIQCEKVDRLKIISNLSDAGRVLADLHQVQTKVRKTLILPALDKTFVDTIKDIDRDEFLYGTNLIEKIKVLKSCQRNGNSIKRTVSTNINNARQGNLNGPPRYNHQRTVPRYGHKKTHYQSSTQAHKNPSQYYRTKRQKPQQTQPAQA